MVSSLGWILLSAQAFRDVYGLPAASALVPFSQPAIVTLPLGFLVLGVVSLLTPRQQDRPSLWTSRFRLLTAGAGRNDTRPTRASHQPARGPPGDHQCVR